MIDRIRYNVGRQLEVYHLEIAFYERMKESGVIIAGANEKIILYRRIIAIIKDYIIKG